ncbi:MAG: hypothetical protein ACD_20C00104G0032 [uncultured bacterium]|nr:MAG: hypothetical protein ACD_20C00104G0032 [uncultured bacterium]
MTKEIVVIDRDGYKLTNYRIPCRRATLWIGQTCNLRCKFCYYTKMVSDLEHPQHSFMSINKIKQICKVLVGKYNNNSVDIEGGEPTIYKDIHELIKYCNEIGLKPTLITNGLVLDKTETCQKFKESGIYDFLISVHAIGDVYDEIVQVKGASARQLKALDNLIETGIPFRFNTVLSKEVLPQLMDVAKLAVEKGARAVNFIAYNPFNDQSTGRTDENIPKYTEIIEKLAPALDYLDENFIEANVRYLPFCVFEEKYRKFIQNFQQRVYDLHEWESAGEVWTSAPSQRTASDELSEPPDFYKHMNNWRKAFRGAKDGALYSHIAEQLAEKFKSVIESDKKIGICLFGNPNTNMQVVNSLNSSPVLKDKFEIKAFISSKAYISDDQIHGYPWMSDEWLAENIPDIILITSYAHKSQIKNLLEEKNLGKLAISVFEESDDESNEYAKEFYLPEMGEIENFTELEYAYKEHRLFCAKINPYYKGDKCQECSIRPICDGFHKDYVEYIGFNEAKSIKLDKVVYDPRFYISDQLKVVEKEDYEWALPYNADVKASSVL